LLLYARIVYVTGAFVFFSFSFSYFFSAVVVIVVIVMTARRCCLIFSFYIHRIFGRDTYVHVARKRERKRERERTKEEG
jgi:hypothetical protein